jgi:hypothetical protein
MEFANATKFHRKSGGAEGSAVLFTVIQCLWKGRPIASLAHSRWTAGPRRSPRSHSREELLLRHRYRSTPLAGMPAPKHQWAAHVLYDLRD